MAKYSGQRSSKRCSQVRRNKRGKSSIKQTKRNKNNNNWRYPEDVFK